LESFRDMRAFPEIKDSGDEKDFTQMIKAVKVRHNNVVPMMALGVNQLKKGMNSGNLDEIHQFLDRFYLSRIGIRMLIGKTCFFLFFNLFSLTEKLLFADVVVLILVVVTMEFSGQHVELHNPNPPLHTVGYIHTKMSPMEVARNASEDARSICFREYGSAPEINIYGDPSFTFP